MSSEEHKVLSQDELRKKLYQTFKSRGVLDTLKTHLRNQLIHELMIPVLSGEVQPNTVHSECSSLVIGASNSLVADHLRRCGYEYSLSVFYPESGLEKDKELAVPDLLQLIGINPKTDIYKALITASKKDNSKGFLVQIITELIEHVLCKANCSTETQTIPTAGQESLAEKLQLIDEQFASMYSQRHVPESFQAKLAEYRKEIEQQLQAEMSQKLHHFKEVEIAKIRMDERSRSQKEISDLQRELDKTYQAKSEALTCRERNAIERLQKQQEIEAREVYLQRQSLLKDIEAVRNREAELKQRIEAFELAQKLNESKSKSLEEALHRREIAVKNMEETYDQKLKNELLKYQLELKEEYIERTKKITEDEKKYQEKARLLHEETISINSKKQEFEQASTHEKELQLEVDSVKAEALLLNKQNQLLMEKLKESSDYASLKEEKMELQVQNKQFKQQLEDIQKENLQLREKLNRPSPDYVILQAELKRVEHARKIEHEALETQKQLLEKRLQNEADHAVQLKSQLSDYENNIRKLNAQMEDLKLRLRQTQTALENEVYRNPKPSLVDHSVLDAICDKIVPHDIYIDGALLKTRPVADFLAMRNAKSPTRHLNSCGSPNSDLEFVATTKARIKELEREAEYLEEAYRSYQHRAIQGTVGPSKAPSSLPLPSTFTETSDQMHCFAQNDVYPKEFPSQSQKSKSYNQTPENGYCFKNNLTPPQKKAAASRRLSSTPVSKAKRNISGKLFSDDPIGSALAAPSQTADQPLSPIPRADNASLPDSPSNTSASSSPAGSENKFSAHQKLSENQNLKQNGSVCDYPEKLLVEDLEISGYAKEYQEDIPEPQKSGMSLQSGDIVCKRHVPAPAPATVTSRRGTSREETRAIEEEGHPGEQHREKQRQEEEKEEERKNHEERSQRRKPEALERERGKGRKLEEEATREENPDDGGRSLRPAQLKSEEPNSSASPNPLEKYMKIIQQSRQQQLENKNSMKEVEVSELELAIEREDSFSAAGTLHEEPDENFW